MNRFHDLAEKLFEKDPDRSPRDVLVNFLEPDTSNPYKELKVTVRQSSEFVESETVEFFTGVLRVQPEFFQEVREALEDHPIAGTTMVAKDLESLESMKGFVEEHGELRSAGSVLKNNQDLHGLVREFDGAGNVVSEVPYDRGRKTGLSTQFHGDGTKTVVPYKDGKVYGIVETKDVAMPEDSFIYREVHISKSEFLVSEDGRQFEFSSISTDGYEIGRELAVPGETGALIDNAEFVSSFTKRPRYRDEDLRGFEVQPN